MFTERHCDVNGVNEVRKRETERAKTVSGGVAKRKGEE